MEDFGWDVVSPRNSDHRQARGNRMISYYKHPSHCFGEHIWMFPGSQKKSPTKTHLSVLISKVNQKEMFTNCKHTRTFTVQPLKKHKSHLYLQTSHFEVGPYYLPCKIVPAFAFLKRLPPLTPLLSRSLLLTLPNCSCLCFPKITSSTHPLDVCNDIFFPTSL